MSARSYTDIVPKSGEAIAALAALQAHERAQPYDGQRPPYPACLYEGPGAICRPYPGGPHYRTMQVAWDAWDAKRTELDRECHRIWEIERSREKAAATAKPVVAAAAPIIPPAFAELMEVCKRRDRIWFALVAKCGDTDKVSISHCEELARKEIAKEAKAAEKAAAKEAKAAAKEASRKMRETPVLMEGRIERRVTPALKRKVAFEQAYCCAACSKGPLEHFDIDHKIPLCRGGTNDKENLWMLCLECHREKTVIERGA